MSCLKNLQRVTYQNDMVMKLIKLYKFHGKEFYYSNVLKSESTYFKKDVVERDATFLVKFLNLNVSEQRLKLIIKNNSEPKNNDEKIAANIKQVIEISCNSIERLDLNANEIDSLVNLIYKGVKRIPFAASKETNAYTHLLEREVKSKREDLNELFDDLRTHVINEDHEITNLICNFFIDFVNIKPFKEANDFIGIIVLYNLLFKYGFTQFRYVSFFETLYSKKDEFQKYIIEANYNWENGFAKVEPLNKFIIDLLLENYSKLEKNTADHDFDSKLNKSNNVENTILKAPNIFTKEYIQSKHPTISKSTLDRTLLRLRDEGKIKALGTGRSAKWQKIVIDDDNFSLETQDTIFDIINNE